MVVQAAANEELRRLRRCHGHSQERLAELSGISVRALRNIESGRAHPYRSTAMRLATALSLPARARGSFVAMWYPDPSAREISDDDLLGRPVDVDAYLSQQARHARDNLIVLHRTCHSYVGADRSVDRSVCTTVVQALSDAVDRTAVVTHSRQPLDWNRLQPCELDNCRLGRTQLIPSARSRVSELLFGQVLARDEQYGFGYTTHYASARSLATDNCPAHPAESARAGTGVLKAGTEVTLQVTFDAEALPGSVSYAFSDRVCARPTLTRALRLSPFHTATITLIDADPGIHEIKWR